MRRLVALLTLVSGFSVFVALSIPASAQPGPACVPDQQGNGAATCTVHLKEVTFPMPVGSASCLPAGTILWTVNGVLHVTLNKLSDPVPDSWVTSTMTGPFTFFPDNATVSTLSGHGTAWFGSENNNQNNVQHFTVNFEVHSADGTTTKLHINADMTISASGNVSFHFDQFVHCP
jgi:hypothetical protein